MKERQRWQPEEDALLLSYVKQYGPKEWNLISHRMGGAAALNRDPKSCLERYKNYLKPGVKKGSLTPEEQSLVVSLQAKYGNKWKKIAAELPGRTPKRLGKWWEVFKEKQLKQIHAQNRPQHGRVFAANSASPEDLAGRGRYDHILDTFAEKYVQPSLLPSWANPGATSSFSSPSCSGTGPASPSVSLTLSPAEPDPVQPDLALIVQCCKELEESREKLEQHKKEATWRLSRLEQQLLAEKARRRKEKMEEIEARVRALREEEMAYLCGMEMEYRERVRALQRDDENREGKLVESWCGTHAKLAKLLEPLGLQSRHTGFNLL